VETTLHSLFPQTFVLHLHPALVNGLTCGKDGEKITRELFGDDFIWIGLCRPGYILAMLCYQAIEKYKLSTGKTASTVILQNHGIFMAADTVEELDVILNKVMIALMGKLKRQPDLSPEKETSAQIEQMAGKIKNLYSDNSYLIYDGNAEAVRFAQSEKVAGPLLVPFTPDHIVYCKAFPLFVNGSEDLEYKFAEYKQKNGYAPKIVLAKSLGFFAVGQNEKDAKTAQMLFDDAIKVAIYSESFGGPLHMTEELVNFIVNWEVESYRQKQN
ncbi:MAG: class II aldolase, partial [Eubacteriales bacterium]